MVAHASETGRGAAHTYLAADSPRAGEITPFLTVVRQDLVPYTDAPPARDRSGHELLHSGARTLTSLMTLRFTYPDARMHASMVSRGQVSRERARASNNSQPPAAEGLLYAYRM